MDFNKGIEKILDSMHNDEERCIEKIMEQIDLYPSDITPYDFSKISMIVMEHGGNALNITQNILSIIKENYDKINEEREKSKRILSGVLKPYVKHGSIKKLKKGRAIVKERAYTVQNKDGDNTIFSYINEQNRILRLQQLEKNNTYK